MYISESVRWELGFNWRCSVRKTGKQEKRNTGRIHKGKSMVKIFRTTRQLVGCCDEDTKALTERRSEGTIKSFNEQKADRIPGWDICSLEDSRWYSTVSNNMEKIYPHPTTATKIIFVQDPYWFLFIFTSHRWEGVHLKRHLGKTTPKILESILSSAKQRQADNLETGQI